jgi:acyl-CoA reductase-like NAD-dependent aldehyde dehydrogenase
MAVIKYDDIEKVIESANNNNYGLGAGVVSEDIN